MQKRLMILGTQFELCELVRMARSRGCYTVVCDGYEDGPARAYADKAYTVDVRQIDEVAAICKEERIDHIITSFSDIMFECMTLIADKAGIPCYMTASQLDAYRRKDETKALCRKLDLKVPAFRLLQRGFSDDDLKGLSFPLIVKPKDSYGSRGLRIVEDAAQLREAFDESADFSTTDEVLAEEISKGQELNCTGFVMDGRVHMLAVSDRMTMPFDASHIPVNYAQHYPSVHFQKAAPLVREALQRFVDATGQKEGPISTQCFFDGTQIEICEIAGRFFGFEHELVTMTTGLSIEKLLLDLVYEPDAVRAALKDHNAKGTRSAFGLYLTSVREGIIEDQSALRELQTAPYVTDSVLFYEEGEHCGMFGPKPYFARYYMTGAGRGQLLEAERDMLRRASALDSQGRELLFRPGEEPGIKFTKS